MNPQEKNLLEEYNKKCLLPDYKDFFPDISIVPDFISSNYINPLLKKEIDEKIDLFAATGKVLYRSIVKVTNVQ